MSFVRSLAALRDPAWVAVAACAMLRAVGIADATRPLLATLALAGVDAAAAAGDGGGTSAADASNGARAVDEIDLTGGTGTTGTSTGGLVDGGMTLGPTTTGTSAPADAATPEPASVPSTAAQGGTGTGRTPAIGSGGLDEAPALDDLRTPALSTDERGGD